MSSAEITQQVALALWQKHSPTRWLSVSGHSMLPLLRPGDQVQVVTPVHHAIGDIVLFQQGRDLIVHRIIRRSAPMDGLVAWVTQGDNCAEPDPPTTVTQLVGKVVALRRGDRVCRLEGPWWSIVNRTVAYTVSNPVFGHCATLVLRLVAHHLHSTRCR